MVKKDKIQKILPRHFGERKVNEFSAERSLARDGRQEECGKQKTWGHTDERSPIGKGGSGEAKMYKEGEKGE